VISPCGRAYGLAPTAEDPTRYPLEIIIRGLEGNIAPGATARFKIDSDVDPQVFLFQSAKESFEISGSTEDISKKRSVLHTFEGPRIQDAFICGAVETLEISAQIKNISLPNGETLDLDTEPLTIRCLNAQEYASTCVPPEELDQGLDGEISEAGPNSEAGPDSDAEVGVDTDADASDADASDADAVAEGGLPIPQSWSIRFLPPPADELIIGIRGTGAGRQDNVLLRFSVEALGEPLNDVEVVFTLPEQAPPGVDILPKLMLTGAEGVPGEASVRLIAGGSPGVVTVEAVACREGFQRDAREQPIISRNSGRLEGRCNLNEEGEETISESTRSGIIVIRGGIPSMDSFNFQCEDSIIPAFTDRPEIDVWLLGDAPGTTCHVHLADRLNGVIDTETQVLFLTEAGSVVQSNFTDINGATSTAHRIAYPTPVNVDPQEELNPADALVTLVAVTRGEEAFIDRDGNKYYEEAFDLFPPEFDLSEPYVDANDNQRFDESDCDSDECENPRFEQEEFRGRDCVEGSCVFEGANGTWDGNIEIWKSTKVLWVGNLSALEFAVPSIDFWIPTEPSYIGGACLNGSCSDSPIRPACPDAANLYSTTGGSFRIETKLVDDNGNCLDGFNQGHIRINSSSKYAMIDGQEFIDIGEGTPCWEYDDETDELIPSTQEIGWTFIDVGDEPAIDDAPEFEQISIELNYKGVSGENRLFSQTILLCR